MINSKEKGARFERQLSSKLNEYGYKTERTAQYCGKSKDSADIRGLPGIHIEAKNQQKMQLYKWMEQAKEDSKEEKDALPAVFHKKNNAKILVTMEFDDWMQLYRSYEADLFLSGKEVEKDE